VDFRPVLAADLAAGFQVASVGVAEAFAEAVTVNLAEEFAWIELILSNMFQ